jgi:F-type H+-transporting ATPase subunit b
MSARKTFFLFAPLFVIAFCLFAPGILLAAEEAPSRWGAWLNIGRFFNLALVIGVLVWAMRKPLATFAANRTQSIREQLEEAQKARQDAEDRLIEMAQRMGQLEDDIRELKASAERESQEEYQRLVDAAEKDADKIVARARQEIDGMTRAAQLELKQHVAQLAVKLAEDKIRSEITSEDRDRLFTEFVSQLRDKK